MVLRVNIREKSFGPKNLFSDIDFSINDGEKVGLIGRNGLGKTTLFNIITGKDTDFTGEVQTGRGVVIVATDQEYHVGGQVTVIEYILAGLPEFAKLSQIIHQFPRIKSPTRKQINEYSDALDRFSTKGYYFIEDQLREELKNFQLENKADQPFQSLSGGEKRLSEIVKIMHSKADLALIDEPTNFMDYIAKRQFIDWLSQTREAIIVISHDRDVLNEVERIIEIKDGAATNYNGSYSQYLKQNSERTSAAMTGYELTERRVKNLKQKVIDYRRLKEKARNPATIHQFKRLEVSARAELAELEAAERPSFWVDAESMEKMGYKDLDHYGKYKAKNIRFGLKPGEGKTKKTLISAKDLAVGYEMPLFQDKSFDLHEGETLEIRGRNGAGKTTLIKALLDQPGPTIFSGQKQIDESARIGIYHQEVEDKYFKLKLPEAINQIYRDQGLFVSDQRIRQLISDYLFTEADLSVLVGNLSGGQKARLQTIAMLANDPNILILDEPTSHLDLPSIEELEHALMNYHGAILYISHDNYFRHKIGGTVLEIP